MNAGAESATGMTRVERKAALSLAVIYALRMLGLSMVLPVFALHAHEFSGNTPALIGLAIGIYGLTQAVFQIPFGMLSDRVGRKPIIFLGLTVFAIGSAVAAGAETIHGVILGRALQGAGAIAAAVLALAADFTREEHRTKVMAVIGGSIGLTFAVAMVLGPLTAAAIGMRGVFWLTAILATSGILLLALIVPPAPPLRFHRDTSPIPAQFRRVLANPNLFRLNAGIALLHFNITAVFTVLPLTLARHIDDGGTQGLVYSGVLLAAIVLMVPFIITSDRHGRTPEVLVGAVATLALAQFMLGAGAGSLVFLIVAMVVFFTALMILEAIIPTLVSGLAPAELKGTALGAYATFQFAGAFLGGVTGGWIHGRHDATSVFLFCATLAVVWFVATTIWRLPRPLRPRLMRVGVTDAEGARRLSALLLAVPGVSEAVVVAEEGVAYLKVDPRALDADALTAYRTTAPAPPAERGQVAAEP